MFAGERINTLKQPTVGQIRPFEITRRNTQRQRSTYAEPFVAVHEYTFVLSDHLVQAAVRS